MGEEEIVIAGGGLCGLATALALHRKGIKSVILERSEELRTGGSGIRILTNGWRALDQLGLASNLRETAYPLQGVRDIWPDKNLDKISEIEVGESRCLRRSDLMNALADALPSGSIRFGCQIVSVKLDPVTSYPVLQLLDGSTIVAKVVIGCDGANSVVGEFLNLTPVKEFGLTAARGLTIYPNGHAFSYEFVRIMKNNKFVGTIPIDDKEVYWFVAQPSTSNDSRSSDPGMILESTLQSLKCFPTKVTQVIKLSDLDSVSEARIRYRSPWDLLLNNFRKGTVTVAGDAMHVMGPFLGQGGSAGLEDGIVLARCLSQKLNEGRIGRKLEMKRIEEAMDEYLRERKMRVARLSMQTYLVGLSFLPSTPVLLRFVCIVLMTVLFADPNSHTRYDCGIL